jgi:hypothetical protein
LFYYLGLQPDEEQWQPLHFPDGDGRHGQEPDNYLISLYFYRYKIKTDYLCMTNCKNSCLMNGLKVRDTSLQDCAFDHANRLAAFLEEKICNVLVQIPSSVAERPVTMSLLTELEPMNF